MKSVFTGIAVAIVLAIGFAPAANAAIDFSVASVRDGTRNLSKAERKKVNFSNWVSSPTAKYVKRIESRGNCKATGGNGKYQGTWQVNADFWKTYGGKKYASKASKATCLEQDLVAYRGWLARGWSPWPPAKNFKP